MGMVAIEKIARPPHLPQLPVILKLHPQINLANQKYQRHCNSIIHQEGPQFPQPGAVEKGEILIHHFPANVVACKIVLEWI